MSNQSALYSEASVPNLAGKTFMVTGANTGIGFDTARVLAGQQAKVLLACRSEANASAACDRIHALHPNALLEVIPLDLGDLSSVRKAAKVVATHGQLDVLVNNAGIMMPPHALTVDGFESQFGVNHLGHFALTHLLLPNLLSTPGSRVVNVSSAAHRGGSIAYHDLTAQCNYAPFGRYAMSKIANLMFTFELQRRLSHANATTIALACHPGGADTDLARQMPSWLVNGIRPLARLVLNSSAEGALPSLRAATDPDATGGDYYGPVGWFELARSATKVQANQLSRNENEGARLWELSLELTGVQSGI